MINYYYELLQLLDILARNYSRYHSSEMILLAEDVWRWLNQELPADSSTVKFLCKYYHSPQQAAKEMSEQLRLLIAHYSRLN